MVGIPEDAFVLLFLGNFTKQKRPDRFIDIINSVKESIPNVHGLMVGDGPLRSAVNDQISTLSLENKITCVGYKNDVRPWISMSDVLLLTSDTEGMPGVVLEAAAMKVSSISGDVGGVAEFIEHGVNGFIVDWNSTNILGCKIVEIINENQDLTMSLREALFDKQRVLSSLLRNEDLMVDSYNRLRIIIKDINSLIEHANFNFTRLEYLQNSFLGLLNIEQNKVIKTFTVVSLVFMPPTLIASIYGMNFHLMPELSSEYGYPIALCLMFISSIIPLAIFKRKKWL
jgi:Mg2+ and Co2+ transporter CorA